MLSYFNHKRIRYARTTVHIGISKAPTLINWLDSTSCLTKSGHAHHVRFVQIESMAMSGATASRRVRMDLQKLLIRCLGCWRHFLFKEGLNLRGFGWSHFWESIRVPNLDPFLVLQGPREVPVQGSSSAFGDTSFPCDWVDTVLYSRPRTSSGCPSSGSTTGSPGRPTQDLRHSMSDGPLPEFFSKH